MPNLCESRRADRRKQTDQKGRFLMTKRNYEQTRISSRLREYAVLYFFILLAGAAITCIDEPYRVPGGAFGQ